MADESDKQRNDVEEEVENNSVEEGGDAVEVNIDDIVTKEEQDAPTEAIDELVNNLVKTLDANRYATKKTVAQGMLDIALLTSNASQLKYVLQVGPKHEFYMLLVILISISIVLQVAMGLVLLSLNLLHDCRFHEPRHRNSALKINYATTATAFIVTGLNLLIGLLFVLIGGLDLNDDDDQPSALILNDVIVIFIFIISVINIIISAFGIEYSNSPLVLERLKYINDGYLRHRNASAGILALVMSSLNTDSEKQKKIHKWLYHTSVGMMTCVVFCDVIKMTFGLDPALSEEDSYSNMTKSSIFSVISAMVAIVLGAIFNINHEPHQKNAEILNNVTLAFKIIGITLNIFISIFYSMHLDNAAAAEFLLTGTSAPAQ